MLTAQAAEKMITFLKGDVHAVCHFLKVWTYARIIGEQEKLDPDTLHTLELASIVHDIACPLCVQKYGNAAGHLQEKEGPALAAEFFAESGLPQAQVDRICELVGHHHTVVNVDGLDWQILLEADFLVNADEGKVQKPEILSFRDKVFQTETGIRLLKEVYSL